MTADTGNLALEHMRHIRARVDRIADDMTDLKLRMSGLESDMVLVKRERLNMDFGQFALLGHQEFQEGSEQTFASDAGVVYKLKEAQVERQFFL